MRKKLIGRKHFEGLIDITDPCYDKDVWCRMNATVKAGTYECRVWKQTEKYEYEGEEHKYQIVGIIGIYLDGIIPPQKQMEEIGSIGVDAGLAGFLKTRVSLAVLVTATVVMAFMHTNKMAKLPHSKFVSVKQSEVYVNVKTYQR